MILVIQSLVIHTIKIILLLLSSCGFLTSPRWWGGYWHTNIISLGRVLSFLHIYYHFTVLLNWWLQRTMLLWRLYISIHTFECDTSYNGTNSSICIHTQILVERVFCCQILFCSKNAENGFTKRRHHWQKNVCCGLWLVDLFGYPMVFFLLLSIVIYGVPLLLDSKKLQNWNFLVHSTTGRIEYGHCSSWRSWGFPLFFSFKQRRCSKRGCM